MCVLSLCAYNVPLTRDFGYRAQCRAAEYTRTEHVLVVPESAWTLEDDIVVEMCRQIDFVVVVEDKCPSTAQITIMILQSLYTRCKRITLYIGIHEYAWGCVVFTHCFSTLYYNIKKTVYNSYATLLRVSWGRERENSEKNLNLNLNHAYIVILIRREARTTDIDRTQSISI